ncbi:stage II sporulation protein P [Eubacteriales bacterium OttesenSCG-928-K08]|nr:stage II sporulation protein P [Eubacteriales bacterium OttesenSCG-928-K08]
MDRTWTKRKKLRINKKKSPRRAARTHRVSELGLRLITAGALVACLIGVMLLSSGSASQRVVQAAMPISKMLPVGSDADSGAQKSGIEISLVDVDEGVGEQMRIEVLSPKTPQAVALGGNEPRILIYHTHTTEAYTQTSSSKYVESGEWRTYEQDKSIVAVGALLAKILREQYGCNVIHDTTDHEPPKLATSYSRSEETMKAYKKKYPSITMFIDVHRDSGGEQKYAVADGKQVARLMFVVGTGEGATGTGFKEMPDFESNYALANAITQRIALVNADMVRNIRIKTGRYNQHISSQCLLVEVGDNMSTLEQALNAMPYLAKAIIESTTEGGAPEVNQNTGLFWVPQGQ